MCPEERRVDPTLSMIGHHCHKCREIPRNSGISPPIQTPESSDDHDTEVSGVCCLPPSLNPQQPEPTCGDHPLCYVSSKVVTVK